MKTKTIKVLVVEDEVLLIRNISRKITAVSDDFDVIGEVYNGKEALDIIGRLHPDIVFTDIRMPIMDGLELARILHEDYPEIYTVIVSGYDDFEYARTVLAYRVYDYLLKPLQKEALEKLLFSLREQILGDKKGQIYEILNHQIKGAPALSSQQSMGLTLESRRFSMFLICLGNLQLHNDTAAGELTYQNEWKTLSEIPLLKDDCFKESDFWFFPYQWYNIKLLLAEDLPDPIQDTADTLHNILKGSMPLASVTLVYSKNTVDFAQLHDMAGMLYKLLSSAYVIGHSAIFAFPSASKSLSPAVLPINFINHFQTLIVSNNTAGFQMAVSGLLTEWEKAQYPQQWIEKILLQFLHILQQNLYFSEDEYDEMYKNIFQILETEQTLSDATDKIVSELLHWLILYQSIPSEIEDTIENLDSFIHSHYTESINLSELAKKYHFNQSYLTRIFKKQKGEAPLKLINTLRINDAKKLLLQPELSVREISEMLGFSNQHYFSRIFKDFTDQLPKEYRIENSLTENTL
ncbi:MAG: response regulator [Lachnospiraceae bacterium]|nr:response regulator [Lachnospiraceae bacterium]